MSSATCEVTNNRLKHTQAKIVKMCNHKQIQNSKWLGRHLEAKYIVAIPLCSEANCSLLDSETSSCHTLRCLNFNHLYTRHVLQPCLVIVFYIGKCVSYRRVGLWKLQFDLSHGPSVFSTSSVSCLFEES